MPIIPSSYEPPAWLKNRDLQTILPALLRSVHVQYIRERIETPDGDFLDLDWTTHRSRTLVVLSHGLEGSTRSRYLLGAVQAFRALGIDTLCWNMRGCSGEPNRKLAWYHSGKSEDLKTVLSHAMRKQYSSLVLIGFSVGGNITLKYLAEEGEKISPRIAAAVTFSVPLDLAESSTVLAQPRNRIYMWWFLTLLKEKIRKKLTHFPHDLSLTGYSEIKTFRQFDDRYTAPLNGFNDAFDYWSRASAAPLLSRISIPTLLINAKDDPFLGPNCSPEKVAKESGYLALETPTRGGHVGFVSPRRGTYWSELRAIEFLQPYFKQ